MFLSCDFLRMVPPKNAFLSLCLPVFGASYYIFGVAPYLEMYNPQKVYRLDTVPKMAAQNFFPQSAPPISSWSQVHIKEA